MRIIIFTADWAPKCSELKSRLATIEKSIPHEYVDAMTNIREGAVRNIKVLPTLVKVDENGTEIGRLIGIKGVEILTDFFN